MPEIELKFLLDRPPQAIFARLRKLGLATGRPVTRNLRSIYFDTADNALARGGLSLRVRREGRRWTQTVKGERTFNAGLSTALESECPAPGGRLRLDAVADETLRNTLSTLVGEAELKTFCEMSMKRSSVKAGLSGAVVELAIDVGTIAANGRTAEFGEIELECKEGDPRGLFHLAKLLFPEGGLRASRLSKSARGHLLASRGRIHAPVEPRKALQPTMARDMTTEHAMRDMLRECCDQVATNVEATRFADDPEGPHQLRVGLRRLRSVFSMFREVAGNGELERLAEECRWLGQEVGKVRDVDAARDDVLHREIETNPAEESLQALSALVEKRGRERKEALLSVLAGPRVQFLLLDLAQFTELRGWIAQDKLDQTVGLARPIDDMAADVIGKCWKRVAKRARHFKTLDAEHRHELRKALKKLRYAVEFFSPIYPPKDVDPFVKRLKRIQDSFGALNDSAMARTMLDTPGFAEPDDAVIQRAVGWVVGSSEARAALAWPGVGRQWQKLKRMRRFWE